MGLMEYAELSRRRVDEGRVDLTKFADYLYSEKIDGWHVVWDGDRRLFTRNGQTLPAPPEFLAMLPKGVPISAELVLRRQQATAVAALRNPRNAAMWKDARLFAFDLPADRASPFVERTRKLRAVVEGQCKAFTTRKCPLRYVTQKRIGKGKAGADAFLSEFEHIVECTGQYKRSAGRCFGEGVVVTDPDSLYTAGRAGLMTRFKFKRREDAEGTVVGYKDKKSLVVSFRNVQFNLGIGLTDAQRAALSQYFPKGSVVKFSFRSLGEHGKPKEARLLGKRYAEDMRALDAK